MPPARRLAAIDIGSNSIRLVVAEAEADGSYRILDEERVMARLGQGLARSGRLAREPVRAALEALRKMKAIADGFRAEVRAVATSAVRDARNGAMFRRAARASLGVRVEIISGRDEALLAHRSAVRHFDLGSDGNAIVDIGGGSLEIVIAKGTLADEVHSLPLGTVRLTEDLCRSDPLRQRHYKALRKVVDRTLRRALPRLPFAIRTLIGSGGTFTALAQMMKVRRGEPAGSVQGFATTTAEVAELAAELRSRPLSERRKVPGLNPRRADIIVAGAIAVARTAKHLKVDRILINERGIRDGILLSMIEERLRRPLQLGRSKLRDRFEWVRLFARKCRSNSRHAEHVGRSALKIFDGLQAPFKMPVAGRELLRAAALLHDVGYLIHHDDHHKHAYHLIRHSGITGFSARELELIANIARYHWGGEPKKSHQGFAQLQPADRKLVRQLSSILRIADALDRTQAQRVAVAACRPGSGRIALTLAAGVSPQVEIWDAQRRCAPFESTFKSRLLLRWHDTSTRRPRTGLLVQHPAARGRPRSAAARPGLVAAKLSASARKLAR